MALLPYDGLPTTRWEMRSTEEVRSGVPFVEGDVLLAKITPCLENGKLGVASGIPGGWGMTSTEVYPLRAELVTTEFLASFLTVPSVRHGLASKMQGATGRQRLPKEALDAFPVPVPPYPEQRAIAAVLRTVQGAKEACERVLAATRQLKQSLLHHLFTYGPVPFPQAAHIPLRELESGEFPSSWVVKRFDELATLQRGQDLARWEFKSGTVPVIGATTVIGYHDTANVKGPGVTVVRSGSSAGKPLFIERDFWAHNVVLYVKDFHGNDPKFAFYMLLVLGLTKFRSGVAVPTLNRNTFSGIQIAVPPLPEQREIAAQLSAVDAKLAAEESRRAALAALFQSLLHHLMTGKVRLPEFAGGQP
jgi:type I restriction enzyme S subunit